MTTQLCRRIQLDLIPLYPADLQAHEADSVLEHAAACSACAVELAAYASQAARFAAAREGRRAPKLDLWEGVRAELGPQLGAPRGEVVAFPGVAVSRRARLVAAAAAILLGSFLAYERLTPPTSQPSPIASSSPVAPLPGPAIADSTGPALADNTGPALAHSTGPALADSTGPALADKGTTPAPGHAPRAARHQPRTFFQDEGSAPFHLAQDREVTPLNEEAEVPGGAHERYRDYEAEPGTHGAPDESATPARSSTKAARKKTHKTTSEDDSLSF